MLDINCSSGATHLQCDETRCFCCMVFISAELKSFSARPVPTLAPPAELSTRPHLLLKHPGSSQMWSGVGMVTLAQKKNV